MSLNLDGPLSLQKTCNRDSSGDPCLNVPPQEEKTVTFNIEHYTFERSSKPPPLSQFQTLAMMGPVAAARPFFFRPGSAFIFKQLSGPASISRPFPARRFSSLIASGTKVQPLICLQCRFQNRVRLYSTKPDADTQNLTSNGPSEEVRESSAAQTTSPDQHPELEPASPAQQSTAPEAASPEAEDPSATPQSTPPKSEATDPESPSSTQQSSPDHPELPSESDSRRTALSHQFSNFMDTLQSRVLVASQTLNDLTGYSAIEAFKKQNTQLEADLATAQETLRHARAHYKAVNAQRASTQREVTTLLARKDTWSPLDLERFTTLYRQDHELETAVQEASGALTEAEADEARLSQALNSGILRRYHEEQIWSDRIRRQSTWGTWGLMGVNVLLFLVLQFVAEPWKRNRLMRGIAAEEKAALEAVRRELEEVKDALVRRDEAEALAGVEAKAQAQEQAQKQASVQAQAQAEAEAETARLLAEESVAADVGVEAVPVALLETETDTVDSVPVAPTVSWMDFLKNPALWRPALEDLYSERRIDLRMRDASLLALEGAVTGAAFIGAIALILMRRS